MNLLLTIQFIYLIPSFSRASLFEIPTKTNTVFDVMIFSITILSEPAGHKIQDEENNILDFCWFEG
jgi:hypothetical protein